MLWNKKLPQAKVRLPVQSTRASTVDPGIPDAIAYAVTADDLPDAIEYSQKNDCIAIAAMTSNLACMLACPLYLCCKVICAAAKALDNDHHPREYCTGENGQPPSTDHSYHS